MADIKLAASTPEQSDETAAPNEPAVAAEDPEPMEEPDSAKAEEPEPTEETAKDTEPAKATAKPKATEREPAKAADEKPQAKKPQAKKAAAKKPRDEKAAEKKPRDEKAQDERAVRIRIPVIVITDPLKAALTVLALVAVVTAGWFVYDWNAAKDDPARSVAAARDQALAQGRQAIVNLNTLDHRTSDRDLKVWQDSATGELYNQIAAGREGLAADVTKNKTVTSAKILEAAVTELDAAAGKATIIAAVRITVTPPAGAATTKISRQAGQLTRTAEGWKLAALGQAPSGG
ncbi:hypothetical protein ACGFNU_31920 [Spirillospora sp. NPDC048911]|uniref:hypothetical protein n=1 Tax=Spirillospora sp. NPDC048911 TaxID=3364527 RepID=UPI0037184F0B